MSEEVGGRVDVVDVIDVRAALVVPGSLDRVFDLRPLLDLSHLLLVIVGEGWGFLRGSRRRGRISLLLLLSKGKGAVSVRIPNAKDSFVEVRMDRLRET